MAKGYDSLFAHERAPKRSGGAQLQRQGVDEFIGAAANGGGPMSEGQAPEGPESPAPATTTTPTGSPSTPPPPSTPIWVGLSTTLGLALAAVVTAQVLAAISEGMALKGSQPQGVPGDLLHRLGYPFGSLGASSGLYLILAVVFVALPPLARQRTTDRQDLFAAIALGLTTVISAVLAIGSILAVRYNLHLYSGARRPTPAFVRIQLIAFLLGALGSSAIAFVGALTAMRLRDQRS
jgi:hypothetical protein